MALLWLIVSICALVSLTRAQGNAYYEGPCFQFRGTSYLHFTPDNFNNSNDIHYSFKFKTTSRNGLLMYSKGDYGDDEALYVRDGKLAYHIFNTSPTGIEGYFGGFFQGNENVNTDQWIRVNVYRIWRVYNARLRRWRPQTGFVVQVGNRSHEHLDYLERADISLRPVIYFGGYREHLSETVRNFVGEIKDIREQKNGQTFETPSLNYKSEVVACSIDIDPV
ncbi:unnamed protein product [Lymnaea stagnalis]|uniref:Laminin G domain-containing protein n=1 Tax=Lymnaea stagnalis TaxID=6523 RepID=A0AAV2I7H7_LYMST